jgi:cytochrome P450
LVSQSRTWSVEDFDPKWSEFVEDPFPFYKRLRSEDPVHFIPSFGVWWFTRYPDVSMILTDPRFRKEAPEQPQGQIMPLPRDLASITELPPSMLFVDPPDHTRLRSLVSKAFTPRVVENLRPRITQIVQDLIELARSRGRMDLIDEFAFPIPAVVITEMLGVPLEDREQFKEWSDRIIYGLDFTQPPEVLLDAARANLELVEYFTNLIEKRRNNKTNDLLSGLIVAEEQGDKLSTGELLSTCVLLLVAGHETTTNLIGSGTLALLLHPEQLELLRAHPELASSATEELLRYESPVQRTARFLSDYIQMGEKKIRRGEVAVAVLGAANRDPQVFKDPESLDITRRENPHVAFGRGIHFCLGAPLARIEAPVAFRLLLQFFPDLTLGGRPEWKTNTLIRGLKSLPVAF